MAGAGSDGGAPAGQTRKQRVLQDKASMSQRRYTEVIRPLRRRLVFRRWSQVEDLRAWRGRALEALARCAAPSAEDGMDISVENIRPTTAFEVVEAMVGERLREEGLEPGTLEGDLPLRPRRKRRRRASLASASGDSGEAPPLADAGGAGALASSSRSAPDTEQLGGASGSASRPAPAGAQLVPFEAEAGAAARPPLKSIREVEAELEAGGRTATARNHERWKETPYLYANRTQDFVQFVDCSVSDPHRWWSDRLAPKRPGADAAQRRRMAKRGELVLTVAVCSTAGHKEQEFDVLASQPMHELRDAFYFASDWMYDGPTRRKSGLFFIDGVFYADRRDPDAFDYSRELVDWMKATQGPGCLREAASRSMATRFSDLDRIPFGERCVYVHQGDIEHAMYFTNARLLRSACDCPYPEAYPILTFMRRYTKRKCYACLMNHAMWIVLDSSRCPHNPSYWCQTCFRHFFQDADGNYVPPIDYKVFPYLHDET